MFINRDWTRTEEDDFKLNVLPRLNASTEAVPQYTRDYEHHEPWLIIGWNLQPRGE
jgi:hypothetical protein